MVGAGGVCFRRSLDVHVVLRPLKVVSVRLQPFADRFARYVWLPWYIGSDEATGTHHLRREVRVSCIVERCVRRPTERTSLRGELLLDVPLLLLPVASKAEPGTAVSQIRDLDDDCESGYGSVRLGTGGPWRPRSAPSSPTRSLRPTTSRDCSGFARAGR